ncbi:gliding motility protein GldN [uncultured Bacteroides sp.]|uniref:type IX secretion system ring protein PorN/GldN n=1 Tax=uncultured Bacteroides sp. TaxID=162156 RepID=UPI002AAB2953|nr:gliding motility protein GldN [uncultured Bacteroides sp.]
MKRFICIMVFLCTALGIHQATAQPKARKAKQEAKESSGSTLSVRAQTQYTGQIAMPQEVPWKREIYRALDLKKEKNTALYYPVEPIGDRMNLFTLIFKLLADGKIPAYEYRLDGNEVLTAESKVKLKDVLDRFHIYYQTKKESGSKDTLYSVDNSDIPSNEVLSYFMKEVWYFDQCSSTYNSKVIAICPVLHRSGDFSMDITKYPMFWLNYSDLSPYLARMNVMTSNLNNTASISMDDYFTTRQYKGDIYKTTNMLNQTLAQYCTTDSAMVKEQKKIEGQLKAFEEHLWVSSSDTTTVAVKKNVEMKKSAVITTDKSVKKSSRRKSETTPKVKVKKESSSSSSAPKASVRRQRR